MKDVVRGSNPPHLASAYRHRPQDCDAHSPPPTPGAQQPGRSGCSSSLPHHPQPKGKRWLQRRSGLIHQPGRKRGRREGAGGGRRSFSAARSPRWGGGGGAPFPPRADCCGVPPGPARVCVRGRAIALGRPDGGNRGFRGRRVAFSSSQ